MWSIYLDKGPRETKTDYQAYERIPKKECVHLIIRRCTSVYDDNGNVIRVIPARTKDDDVNEAIGAVGDLLAEAGKGMVETALFYSGEIALKWVFKGGKWMLSAYRAKKAEGLVNLASKSRTTHILYGDATGGGHMWSWSTLFNGKSKFPLTWSKEKIMHAISEISTSGTWVQQSGRAGSMYTRSGAPARLVVDGTYEGVSIRVVIEPMGEGIITAFPK